MGVTPRKWEPHLPLANMDPAQLPLAEPPGTGVPPDWNLL